MKTQTTLPNNKSARAKPKNGNRSGIHVTGAQYEDVFNLVQQLEAVCAMVDPGDVAGQYITVERGAFMSLLKPILEKAEGILDQVNALDRDDAEGGAS